MFKKTKIIVTIGPSSQNLNMLTKMIYAGMDIARLNFSHGFYADHKKSIDLIRKASKKTKKPVAILQDLCGPKIRIGDLYKESIILKPKQKFILTTKECIGDESKVFINYKNIVNDVKKGDIVLIDDGKIELKIEKIINEDIYCKIIIGGELKSKKGVNFPNTSLSISSLTEKDKKDVLFGIKNKVNFIALSFVKTAEDIISLKNILKNENADIKVIAKIETQEALKNIDEILKEADGIMVARGDLAVEIGPEKVPIYQKNIVEKCNKIIKPVIIATQMLESMIKNPFPTRAEVNDIANAILDGADAVMLSGETATGSFPLKAVETMARVSHYTEPHFDYEKIFKNEFLSSKSVNDSVSYAVANVAYKVGAKLIVALTETGHTAKMISRYRPKQIILALTPNLNTYFSLKINFGCYPYLIRSFKNLDHVIDEAKKIVLKNNLANKNDKIVICAGIPFGKSGSTNFLIVQSL